MESLKGELGLPEYAALIKDAGDAFAAVNYMTPPMEEDAATMQANNAIRDNVIAKYQKIAGHLAQKTADVPVPTAAEDVIKYLTLAGRWARLSLISEGIIQASDEQKMAARTLINALDHLSTIEESLSTASAATLISEEDKAAILGLCKQTVPAWTLFAHREPDFGDVMKALGASWDVLSMPNPDETPKPSAADIPVSALAEAGIAVGEKG